MIIQTAAQLTGNADKVGWICFVLGVILVVAGAAVGLILSIKQAGASANVVAAKAKVGDVKDKANALQATATAAAKSGNVENDVADAAEAAGGSIDGVLKEVASMIGALPERDRFSGLLVILGALLMSVATVQFGGHSIF